MADKPPSATNPLPPGWKESYDENRKRWYFYNSATKQSQWHHPGLPAEKKPIWVEKFDDRYQRPYWYNRKTKQSSWTKPTDEASIYKQDSNSSLISSSSEHKRGSAQTDKRNDDGSNKGRKESHGMVIQANSEDDLSISESQRQNSDVQNSTELSQTMISSPKTSRLDAQLRTFNLAQSSVSSDRSEDSGTMGSPTTSRPPKSPTRKRSLLNSAHVRLQQSHSASSFNTGRESTLQSKYLLASMQRSSAEDVQKMKSNDQRHYSSKVPSNESLVEPTSPVELSAERVPVGAQISDQPKLEIVRPFSRQSPRNRRNGAYSTILKSGSKPPAVKTPPVILTSHPAFSELHKRRLLLTLQNSGNAQPSQNGQNIANKQVTEAPEASSNFLVANIAASATSDQTLIHELERNEANEEPNVQDDSEYIECPAKINPDSLEYDIAAVPSMEEPNIPIDSEGFALPKGSLHLGHNEDDSEDHASDTYESDGSDLGSPQGGDLSFEHVLTEETVHDHIMQQFVTTDVTTNESEAAEEEPEPSCLQEIDNDQAELHNEIVDGQMSSSPMNTSREEILETIHAVDADESEPVNILEEDLCNVNNGMDEGPTEENCVVSEEVAINTADAVEGAITDVFESSSIVGANETAVDQANESGIMAEEVAAEEEVDRESIEISETAATEPTEVVREETAIVTEITGDFILADQATIESEAGEVVACAEDVLAGSHEPEEMSTDPEEMSTDEHDRNGYQDNSNTDTTVPLRDESDEGVERAEFEATRKRLNSVDLLNKSQSVRERMEALRQKQGSARVALESFRSGLLQTEAKVGNNTFSIHGDEGEEAPRKRTQEELGVSENAVPVDDSVEDSESLSSPGQSLSSKPALGRGTSVKDLVAQFSGGPLLPIQFAPPSNVTAPVPAALPQKKRGELPRDLSAAMSTASSDAGEILSRAFETPVEESNLTNDAHLTRAAIPRGLRREPSRRPSNFAETMSDTLL